jgi:hypothetical protein
MTLARAPLSNHASNHERQEESPVMTATKNRSTRRSVTLWVAFAAALVLLGTPITAHAADYFVVGRAYSAAPLAPGEPVPTSPLSGATADQVIGDNLIASVPRNLVRVRVLSAADGQEFASYITRQDGGYLASFSAPAGGASVRFVVEELATSKQLLYSEPNTVTAPVSIRYLLLDEVPSEVDGGRDFAPPAPPPAMYTAIFTRVGKIELATEVGGVTQHLIDPATGLANVPASVASELAIPQYEDAPFGGNLYVFGAFSQDLYSIPGVCYKIRIYPDPNDHTVWDYMDDELVKTRYTVDFTIGTVDTERVSLGPKTVGATTGCYELTPIAASNNVFWSFPDLVALWRTAGLDGDFELEFEFHGLPIPADFALIPDFSDVTLRLDNVAPVAVIQPLQAGDFDTPRVYTPGPVPPSSDLLPALLGGFPVDYGGAGDPTCLIFSLQPAAPPKFLAFRLTASHTNSFLRYWSFFFQRNDTQNAVVFGKRYDGVTNSMVDLPGVLVSSAQTSTAGFADRYLYLDSAHLQPSGTPVSSCAYRFLIHAATRTTDGYQYLRYRQDQDLHYVQKDAAP